MLVFFGAQCCGLNLLPNIISESQPVHCLLPHHAHMIKTCPEKQTEKQIKEDEIPIKRILTLYCGTGIRGKFVSESTETKEKRDEQKSNFFSHTTECHGEAVQDGVFELLKTNEDKSGCRQMSGLCRLNPLYRK